ncbi:hypothetical protein MXD62_01505 [Frankia sp. Mgl5]|uniref:hypothetical protein n=1 Tax=Frankia sp. Mgl5 TaxID=2933793 RepID=UPI00200F357C|nr:hypothetical protein [Frankia sp. Mgl5]MCK9925846.1 hypothetical protein [Frankia sp. Mgl5]
MYELNRMRLFSAGPRGARYNDVTLDLSAVGAEIGGQNSLFAAPVRRPSPFSLLILENGGGKSVLLKLLFSVVLPGRRNVVGGSAAVMEKFVLGENPAHVVLEWMHVRTGDLVVTGKTMQWKRARGADGSKLTEAWWSLRPHDGLGLETLPFIHDSRHVRLEGFHGALTEIDRASPATQLNWSGDGVREWADHLRSLGIEPDLFAIQRRMNADEGDAADAFRFRSSRDFVEWLLKTVLDPADAVTAAENFDSYATNIGDREAMLLEHQFLTGVVDTLTATAEAHTACEDAAAGHRSAARAAAGLLGAVQARAAAEHEAATVLRQEHVAAAGVASTAESDRDKARDTVNEIRRQTLLLQIADAVAERETADTDHKAAEVELVAWAAVDYVEERDTTMARAAAIAARITEAEEAARPAQEKRDEAAAGLLAKLHAEISAAQAEVKAHDTAAGEYRKQAVEIDGRRDTAVREAERLRGDHRTAEALVAEVRRAVDAAVGEGLLAADSTVADAAARAATAASETAARLQTAEKEAAAAGSRTRALDEEARKADKLLREVTSAQQEAMGALRQATSRAALIASDGHVLRLLAADTGDVDELDAHAAAVIEALHADITAAEINLAELHAAQRTDQRLLDALGDGGLLPPRPEVDQAVAVLRGAGIAAHAGWRYLAENVPAAERVALVAARPQLADGVVLIDPSALPAARVALVGAQLLPSAAVAVGTGAGLLSAAESDDAQFVVEPNPALFDLDAAEQRRGQLRPMMADRGADITARAVALEGMRTSHAELVAWRRVCPSGTLAALRATADAAEAAVAEAAVAVSEAVAAVTAAEELRDQLADELPGLRSAERVASERAGDLRRLANRVAEVDVQRRRLPELVAAAETAEERARVLDGERQAALGSAEEAARAAENARGRAERLREDLGSVTSSTGKVAATVPDRPLPELRSVYNAAQVVYLAVEVGQDLRAEAQAAESAAALARATVAGRPPEIIARAEQLLASTEGADRGSRASAAARLDRDRDRHAAAHIAAVQRISVLDTQLEQASPGDQDRKTWTTLLADRRPRDVAHGQELLLEAQSDQRRVQEALDDAVAVVTSLGRQLEEATEAARVFDAVAAPLETALEDLPADDRPIGPIPFEATADVARTRAGEVRDALRRARAADEAARGEVHRRAQAVQRFSREPRFEAMTNVVRRSLLGLDPDQIAARANGFAGALAQRLQSLTIDLERAHRHRKAIVDRLVASVEAALGTLRTASRLSKLPKELGDWDGKEFLRIRFPEPDPSLLVARVGDVVDKLAKDAAASQPGARGAALKRDGMSLLLRAVEAAVPRGLTVEILKPDSVLRDERVPVEQMKDVFSGGQRLTAAIVLYCTLAALRANERGQMRTRHSGVLFLDNPIGTASAEYLLDVQKGVAAALGVQLVYTTGLSDDRALAAFPLWVRMRNDADLRAGLKYIRVAEIVRNQLPEPYPDHMPGSTDDLPGTVTATRVYRRPA